MSLTKSQKQRQKDLYNKGFTGQTSAELHRLNVAENADKSSAQCRREIAERLAVGKPVKKLIRTLEERGEL